MPGKGERWTASGREKRYTGRPNLHFGFRRPVDSIWMAIVRRDVPLNLVRPPYLIHTRPIYSQNSQNFKDQALGSIPRYVHVVRFCITKCTSFNYFLIISPRDIQLFKVRNQKFIMFFLIAIMYFCHKPCYVILCIILYYT